MGTRVGTQGEAQPGDGPRVTMGCGWNSDEADAARPTTQTKVVGKWMGNQAHPPPFNQAVPAWGRWVSAYRTPPPQGANHCQTESLTDGYKLSCSTHLLLGEGG